MVLLLENGRIVERGAPKELLKESSFLAMQLRNVTPGMAEAVAQ